MQEGKYLAEWLILIWIETCLVRGGNTFSVLGKMQRIWLGDVSPGASSAPNVSPSRIGTLCWVQDNTWECGSTHAWAQRCISCWRWRAALGEWFSLATKGLDPFPAVRTTGLSCSGGLLQGSWSPSPQSQSVFPNLFPMSYFNSVSNLLSQGGRKSLQPPLHALEVGCPSPGHYE